MVRFFQRRVVNEDYWLVALGRNGPPTNTHPHGINGVDEDVSLTTNIAEWEKSLKKYSEIIASYHPTDFSEACP